MSTYYQVTVSRSILSYSRADTATQAQLLDSYRAIIQEYEDAQNLDHEPAELSDGVISIDEYIDDPRHGQAEAINRGEL